MSRHNTDLGRWGEQIALAMLTARGYVLRGRNVRTPHGEIDLVFEHDGLIVFVEVKTRTDGAFGQPEHAVDSRKQAHLLASAEHYAQQHAIDHWRIDVIAIQGRPGGRQKVRHFENALS